MSRSALDVSIQARERELLIILFPARKMGFSLIFIALTDFVRRKAIFSDRVFMLCLDVGFNCSRAFRDDTNAQCLHARLKLFPLHYKHLIVCRLLSESYNVSKRLQ